MVVTTLEAASSPRHECHTTSSLLDCLTSTLAPCVQQTPLFWTLLVHPSWLHRLPSPLLHGWYILHPLWLWLAHPSKLCIDSSERHAFYKLLPSGPWLGYIIQSCIVTLDLHSAVYVMHTPPLSRLDWWYIFRGCNVCSFVAPCVTQHTPPLVGHPSWLHCLAPCVTQTISFPMAWLIHPS